jgi:hypothetical protein
MTEQLLDDPEVGSALQEVGRERMAQRVRRDPVGEAGTARRAADDRERLLARQTPAAVPEE